MKVTGLDLFDTTIHKTNSWLKEIDQEMNLSDRRRAYLALRCVLHAIRDHLEPDMAVHFGDQLPMLVRGFYFEHWVPSKTPVQSHSREELLYRLSSQLTESGETSAQAEAMVRAVFRLLERKATEGEIEDPYAVLPPTLQEFWPGALRGAA